jgi:hypothetical protein
VSSPEYPADSSPFRAPSQLDAPVAAPTAQLHELRLNDPVSAPAQEWSQETQYQVVLRLTDGDTISLGGSADSESAAQYAKEVVRYIAQIPADEWPFFGGRYLRPELIASVDLVERRSMSWGR